MMSCCVRDYLKEGKADFDSGYFFSVQELHVDNPGETTERIPVYIKLELPRIKCECKYICLHV